MVKYGHISLGGEMVYTRVLEARAVRRGGSSPLPGTI